MPTYCIIILKFTRLTSEEDINIDSSKLGGELSRMNDTIDLTRLAFVEEQVIRGNDGKRYVRDCQKYPINIVELNVKVLFVIHLFEFSVYMYHLKLKKQFYEG